MADERSRARAYLRATAARLKTELEAVTEALDALQSPTIRGARRALTDEQVREIRRAKDPNITDLSRRFNVDRHTIRDVLTGKRYKGVK